MRSIRLFFKMTSVNLRGLMSYKIDFLVSFFGGLLSQTIGLLFLVVLFQNIPAVAGWNVYEVAMLYGYMFLAEGVLTLSFQGTNNMWKLIRMGSFDRFLLRPLSVQLQIYGLQTNLAGLGTGITGLVVIFYSMAQLEMKLSMLEMLLFLSSLILGSVIRININFMCSCFAVIYKGAMVRSMVYKLQDMAKYPITIYPRTFQVILLSLIPFAAISYIPTAVLLGKLSLVYYLILPLSTILTIEMRRWTLKKALEKYEGSGN